MICDTSAVPKYPFAHECSTLHAIEAVVLPSHVGRMSYPATGVVLAVHVLGAQVSATPSVKVYPGAQAVTWLSCADVHVTFPAEFATGVQPVHEEDAEPSVYVSDAQATHAVAASPSSSYCPAPQLAHDTPPALAYCPAWQALQGVLGSLSSSC